MDEHTDIFPIIAVEGACDRVFGRPRERNPYDLTCAREHARSWDMGWCEAARFLEMRGQEEASRWLGQAA